MPRGKPIDAEWLRKHYPTMTDINELLDDYEAKFGHRPCKTSVYLRANKLGIKKVPVADRDHRAERTVYWTKEPEMEAWMLEHDKGQHVDLISEKFRERFGFGLARHQINLFRASHGTQVRQDGTSRGGRKRVPVGTERVGKDGFIFVKFREQANVPMSKDNWRQKHILVWEREHGPLPEGTNVYFADGNNRNFNPSNLVAVPRRFIGVMNGLKAEGYGWHDAETLRAVMALAELRISRNDAMASMSRTCPCCGRKFDNRGRRSQGNIASTVCPECGAANRKPPNERKRTYDHDEIRRLHDAGMRNEEIAHLMGCTASTVSNAIHRTSEKRRERRWQKTSSASAI